MRKFLFSSGPFLIVLGLACLVLPVESPAKTRWSSIHLVPDADMLVGGQLVADGQGYFLIDSAKGPVINPTMLLHVGVTEWVNLELGYAGGLTLGFKARILGETGKFLPSLTLGAHNIMSHKQANYFGSKDTMGNEFFVALAKSADALRMRFHLGVQTIPTSKTDQLNPFFGVEEYFGNGVYATLELERRKEAFWPSIFGSWRIFNKKLEIAAGAVAFNRLFFDKNNKFSFSLTSNPDSGDFVRPGIWFGVRYSGTLTFGGKNVFSSMEERIIYQGEMIESLRKTIDSMKTDMSDNQIRMAKVNNSLLVLSDSMSADKNRFKALVLDKIILLKTVYESEPFDPEMARQVIARIVALKETCIPILKDLITDKKQDRQIRMLSISLLGDMGGKGASDVLLDVLSQSEDPNIKIEILIALGKIKETRAVYVLEQLANDPIDVVAFTAQEVLQKLIRDKGIRLPDDFKMRQVSITDSPVIHEEKIPVVKPRDLSSPGKKDTTGSNASGAKTAAKTGKTDSTGQIKTPDDKTLVPNTGKGSQAPKNTKPLPPDTAQQKSKALPKTDSTDVWGVVDTTHGSPVKAVQAGNAAPTVPVENANKKSADSVTAVKDTGGIKPGPAPASETKPQNVQEVSKEKSGKKIKEKKTSAPAADEKNW